MCCMCYAKDGVKARGTRSGIAGLCSLTVIKNKWVLDHARKGLCQHNVEAKVPVLRDLPYARKDLTAWCWVTFWGMKLTPVTGCEKGVLGFKYWFQTTCNWSYSKGPLLVGPLTWELNLLLSKDAVFFITEQIRLLYLAWGCYEHFDPECWHFVQKLIIDLQW